MAPGETIGFVAGKVSHGGAVAALSSLRADAAANAAMLVLDRLLTAPASSRLCPPLHVHLQGAREFIEREAPKDLFWSDKEVWHPAGDTA